MSPGSGWPTPTGRTPPPTSRWRWAGSAATSEPDRVDRLRDLWRDLPGDEDPVPDLEDQDRPDPPGVVRLTRPVRVQHGEHRGRVQVLVGVRRGDDRPRPLVGPLGQ